MGPEGLQVMKAGRESENSGKEETLGRVAGTRSLPERCEGDEN